MTRHVTLLVALATFAGLLDTCVAQGAVEVRVNSSWARGEFVHFWRSTGFCPPEPHSKADQFDLSNDILQNLAYIGAVPHGGIEQVRIHWLLSLVKVEGMLAENPVYHFSKLDALLDWLHASGLRPGFELMGNPSNIFTNFDDKQQVYRWRSLVQQTAERYLHRYGKSYVLGWNWESWNEPDCLDFDSLHITTQGFLNYYDACSEGLKAAHLGLKLGGPASGCATLDSGHLGKTTLSEALLQHVVNGTNFFTGQHGVRLDFLSVHKKGGGSSLAILNQTLAVAAFLKDRYPTLANKPLYNDEADPLVGWNKDEAWRGGQTYAAMVVKVIAQHQNLLRAPASPVNFSLLSNDNGFLSFNPHQFTQRTLLARFQMNNTSPHYTTFVRKSAYGAMCMLSLLGDQWLYVNKTVAPSGTQITNDSYFGALATLHEPKPGNSSDSWQMTVLLYESADTQHGSRFDELILNWYIAPPRSSGPLMMAGYFMNDGGPYEMWKGLYNSTPFPTPAQFKALRSIEEPRAGNLYPVKNAPGLVPIPPMFQLLEPDVVVMHLCARPPRVPEAPVSLRFVPVTTGQVLVVWSDTPVKTKCIKTYEVQASTQSASGPFHRINDVDSIVAAFVYSPSPPGSSVRGWYRVRALDYWGRSGDFSSVTFYPGGDSLSGR